MRYPQSPTFAITLDRSLSTPLQVQLTELIKAAIRDGVLAGGARMPATRTLARLAGVSRNLVCASYDDLVAQGLLVTVGRAGTYVRAEHPRPTTGRPGPNRPVGRSRPPRRAAAPDGRAAPAGLAAETVAPVDLRPGQLDVAGFPVAAWRAAWRRAGHRPPLAEPAPYGSPALRLALAGYLRDVCGVVGVHHEVLVTRGVAPTLRLLLAAEMRRARVVGRPSVLVADPAPPTLPEAVRDIGGLPVPLPVESTGRDGGPPSDCRIVLLADALPPLGAALGPERAAAMADWARRTDGLVVEVMGPTPPPPGTDRLGWRLNQPGGERCVVVGDLAALLPGVSVGWALVPRSRAAELGARLRAAGGAPSAVVQDALAHLLGDPATVRWVRRTAAAAEGRRELLAAVWGGPVCGVAPSTAVLPLPSGHGDRPVVAALARRGVRVAARSAYHLDPFGAPPGLVIGYGHLTDDELRAAVTGLRAELATIGQLGGSWATAPRRPAASWAA